MKAKSWPLRFLPGPKRKGSVGFQPSGALLVKLLGVGKTNQIITIHPIGFPRMVYIKPKFLGLCLFSWKLSLWIQSPCQMMIGVYNHILSKVFWFHYHSQKVIGSLGYIIVKKNSQRMPWSSINSGIPRSSWEQHLWIQVNLGDLQKPSRTRGWWNGTYF